jgi:hypothetical protein
MRGFVYPWFVGVVERAEGHFCPDVYNDGYRNVSALLSKLGSPSTFVKQAHWQRNKETHIRTTSHYSMTHTISAIPKSRKLRENQDCCHFWGCEMCFEVLYQLVYE